MFEGQALLAFLGVLVVSGMLAARGWQKFQRPVDWPEQAPVRYLPDQTNQSAMPILGLSERRDSTLK